MARSAGRRTIPAFFLGLVLLLMRVHRGPFWEVVFCARTDAGPVG